jgi:type I restriction enzyme S subunit
MNEWIKAQLADLIEIRHGFAFQGEYFSSDGPGDLLVTPGNFSIGGGFQWGKPKYYFGPVPVGYVLSPGDVIVSMTDLSKEGDTLGYSAVVPTSDMRLLHNQRIGKVVMRNEKSDLSFVHWLLRTPSYRNEVLASCTGSTVKHTSPTKILAFEFMLPPLWEQKAIAHILGVLDDKIDLNCRMNETLESIVRAIFKDWFVDFGPTRAKMEGRVPYLAPELWSLFPHRIDGKGKPEGWRITALQEVLAELETGGRPKGGVSGYASGVPSVGAESIVGLGKFDYTKTKYVPPEFFEAMTRGHVKSRDVLLYKDGGRPGEFEPHLTLVGEGFPFDTFAINEHVYRMRAKSDFGQALLYFWLSSELVMEEMRVKGTGVAIPGLNSTQVKSLTTLVPLPDVARSFDALVEPMISRVLANCNEARSLAKTRDLLLPKLMSGEIRVREAEQTVQAVA